jgi:hypothetical protein
VALTLASLVASEQASAQQNPAADVADPVGNALVAGPNTYRSSLDDLIARAMENHPDVAAAKAKVALAEAELKSKRLEVARDIISLSEGMNEQVANVQRCESTLSELTNSVKKVPNSVPQQELRRAQSDLEVAKAKLDHTANELRHLTAVIAEKSTANDLGGRTSAPSAGTAARSQMPQGPVADKIKLALDERTDMEFADNPQPLKDVVEYISARHGFPHIYIHPDVPDTFVIKTSLKDVPLRYAFEAIQELTKGEVCFVVRDYGILIVNKDAAEQSGYVSAVDFGRDPSATTRYDPPRQGSSFVPDHDLSPRSPASKAEESLRK